MLYRMRMVIFCVLLAGVGLCLYLDKDKHADEVLTPVKEYGQLQVIGANLCDEQGNPIQLVGLSSHGLHNCDFRLNRSVFETLRDEWGCDVVRIAVYTEVPYYEQDFDKNLEIIKGCLDTLIDLGMYVIIDWHTLDDGDPNKHKAQAISLFREISMSYGQYPNIIYEICNEPNSNSEAEVITWDKHVKPYARDLIRLIRAYDPDNIIITGTANYCRDIESVINNPLEGENIMYSVHFAAGSHGQALRDQIKHAMNEGLPIFISNWYTTNTTRTGEVYIEQSMDWIRFMEENKISWCYFSFGSSLSESSNVLKNKNSSYEGHWKDNELSKTGLFIKEQLLYKQEMDEAIKKLEN